MEPLLPIVSQIAEVLTARGDTVAVAESSCGGLIAAALLAVPGASAYFRGGAVVYTYDSRRVFLDLPPEALPAGMRPSTEPYALLLAGKARERLGTTWGIGESGASGPTGNRYGDPAGHVCLAVVGPVEHTLTLETASPDRLANMSTFAAAALDLLLQSLSTAP